MLGPAAVTANKIMGVLETPKAYLSSCVLAAIINNYYFIGKFRIFALKKKNVFIFMTSVWLKKVNKT